jgi:glucose/mannose-6-phosphate isomerase
LSAEALAKADGEGRTAPHGRFHLVLLRDADDHPRVLRRFDVTLALLRETGVSASILPIEGTTLIEKFFATLLVGDWASYTLALALGVDPSPVSMVEDLKKRLKE